ncbi:hypothetical protein TRIUR3_21307 [Triticum urartu]|uniref:Uncharacterized protein n=1 Tax=Triticum urartu TaxID=4572 RepID=M7YGV9_TRIUA|nr:hypothetical protein TRIUR3_21307 [Triticum urartu]
MPTVVLHTGSAAAIRLFRSYAMLHDKGYLPAQEHELDKPVKELAPIRVSDLFDPSKYPNPEMANRLLDTATEVTDNSSGVVINTFEALETPELEAIRSELAASGVGHPGASQTFTASYSLTSHPKNVTNPVFWLLNFYRL